MLKKRHVTILNFLIKNKINEFYISDLNSLNIYYPNMFKYLNELVRKGYLEKFKSGVNNVYIFPDKQRQKAKNIIES